MIPLHPVPAIERVCPDCGQPLRVNGWYMPGMRVLADLDCPRCGETYYADLPTGHGLIYPMLIEQRTGRVIDENNVSWFADLLRRSYEQRDHRDIPFNVEQFRSLENPLLLSCLDFLYGHALLKLLSAQYYLDHQSKYDLILLIPQYLRWMVPDGVAAVWTVGQPLREGWTWNDALARQINQQISNLKRCDLAIALPHPFLAEFAIERFTRVKPFNVTPETWAAQTRNAPTVTFIWREDRYWAPGGKRWWRHRKDRQEDLLAALAADLRRTFPQMHFAVAGLGAPGRLPRWIEDHRTRDISPKVEIDWCALYSRSQIVIGVHGSNMLLPSALAGAVVELLPDDRLGNIAQDLLLGTDDPREALVRYRFISAESRPKAVAAVVASMLRQMPSVLVHFNKPWENHGQMATHPRAVSKAWRQIA